MEMLRSFVKQALRNICVTLVLTICHLLTRENYADKFSLGTYKLLHIHGFVEKKIKKQNPSIVKPKSYI